MPKALVFPSYRGGGFGHIGRCLSLAQELAQRGWETAFVLDGQHAERIEAQGYQVLRPRRALPTKIMTHLARLARPSKPRPEPTYSFFASLSPQVVRDGFYSPQSVRQRVQVELSMVRQFKPDVLIGDTWLLTSIVGRLAGLPVVQITKSIVHPDAPCLAWWRERPSSLVDPDVRPVFNPALDEWGFGAIRQAEDLLGGELLLVPSIPELDPLPQDLPRTHYVGPLTRQDPGATKLVPPFEELSSDPPLVYVTLGGGADPVGSEQTFAVFDAAFEGMDAQVIISTGLKFSADGRPAPPANVQYHRWVPGPAIISRSKCVVFHGGYGTTMETARYGVPSVVLPFHSEQEANGRRLEAAGMARVIAPDLSSCQVVHQSWPYGEFTLLVRYEPFLSATQLRETVQDVLRDASYTENAKCLQKRLLDFGGPAQAADLVQGLVS
jgi:UDP:flavonoid glycosyltransferase YjiC (YdhE family)